MIISSQFLILLNNSFRIHLIDIIGLDPARPLMAFQSNDNKLNPSHADFVDVIHTNSLIQGQLEPAGHVDFYMNNVINQPGCSSPKSSVFGEYD